MSPPSFVNNGTFTQSVATSITPPLPGSLVNGNLLIAFAYYTGSTTPETWTVSSGWTIFASIGQGDTRPLALAYQYVTGSETAPVFTPTDLNVLDAQVMQYTGTLGSSPIGNISSNRNTTGWTAVTCPAIIASANNGLAVNVTLTNLSTPISSPAGWTTEVSNNSATISDLVLATTGTSSGATSVSGIGANYDVITFELLSEIPVPLALFQGLALMGAGL